jgi:hypothetical protein
VEQTYLLTSFQELQSTAVGFGRNGLSLWPALLLRLLRKLPVASLPRLSERSFFKAHFLQQTPRLAHSVKAALSYLFCHFILPSSFLHPSFIPPSSFVTNTETAHPKQCKCSIIHPSSSLPSAPSSLRPPLFHHLSTRRPSSGAPQPSLTRFPPAAQHRVSSNSLASPHSPPRALRFAHL